MPFINFTNVATMLLTLIKMQTTLLLVLRSYVFLCLKIVLKQII